MLAPLLAAAAVFAQPPVAPAISKPPAPPTLPSADAPPAPEPPDPSPDIANIPTLIAQLAASAPPPAPRQSLDRLIRCGEPAVPGLVAALHSSDYQQRQLAAAALRALSHLSRDPDLPWSPVPIAIEPTDALIRVCIEGLKSDSLPDESETTPTNPGRENTPRVSNAASGTRFLVHHVAKAEPALARALQSTDLQQRFCAAVILGFGRRTAHAERICAILIPHLRDNSIPFDALWAACALRRLGPAADVHLQAAALAPVDAQQRELLTLILLDIRKPLPRPDDYGPRAAGKVPSLHLDGDFDPLIAFDEHRLKMDWGAAMTEKNRDTPRPPPQSAPGPSPAPTSVFVLPPGSAR